MSVPEYNAGKKIDQLAVQLSGFYGTYNLEGYDETSKSWVNIDPAGLTYYNTPRSASEHTRLFWLDLRNRNITRLRLSASHARYYGVPSQVSVPIIRTQYDGPNIYLTPASPNNIVLQWSDGGNPQGMTYEIWRETLSDTGQVLKDERIGSTTALTFVTTDQEPGKRYRYRVRATDGSEFSAFTTPIEYYTPPVVTATPGERQISLSWTPVTGSDTYVIYLEEDGVWRNTSMITGATGQVVIPNLSPNKRYRVRLEQYDPKHTGVPWAVLANDGEYVAPIWGPPGAPRVDSLAPRSVSLSWDASGFPSGTFFRLYRNGTKIYEGPLTSYTDTEVTPGVQYRYKVAALNVNFVEGVFSPEVSVIPPNLVAPILQLSGGQPSAPWNVILTWDANGNAPGTTYEVWRETLSPSGSVIADERIGTTTSNTFETTDQTSGQYYRYRIRVVEGSNHIDSNTVSYWTPPIPSVVAQQGALLLNWSSPVQGASVNLYVHDGTSWRFVRTTTDTSAVIDSLSPSQRYQVALEPANLPNGGYPWRAVAAGTPVWHAPGSPTYSNITPTSVTVSWEPNGIAPGTIYQLFRNGVLIWQGSDTSFTDTNLNPNTTYRYKVAALNADFVPGAFTPETSVTTARVVQEPQPGYSVLRIENARYGDYTENGVTYYNIPHVRSQTVTLQWQLGYTPEWVRYGSSLNSMGPEVPFVPTDTFTLPLGVGLKTIYVETSIGERYYLMLVNDSEPPSVSLSWLGNATVTKPGGKATLIIRAQDNLYPESDLEVSIDNGPWQPYQYFNELDLSGQGTREVIVRVRDPAGNVAIQGIPIFVLP